MCSDRQYYLSLEDKMTTFYVTKTGNFQKAAGPGFLIVRIIWPEKSTIQPEK